LQWMRMKDERDGSKKDRSLFRHDRHSSLQASAEGHVSDR
jgi:hypothetical protein